MKTKIMGKDQTGQFPDALLKVLNEKYSSL